MDGVPRLLGSLGVNFRGVSWGLVLGRVSREIHYLFEEVAFSDHLYLAFLVTEFSASLRAVDL